MYCIYCGTENPQEAKYCRHCGKAVYQKEAESGTYAYSYKRADPSRTQRSQETGKNSSDTSGTYAYAYKRAETAGTGDTAARKNRESGNGNEGSSGTYAYAYKRAEPPRTGSSGTSAQKQAASSAAPAKPKAPVTAQPKKKRGFFATLVRIILWITVISMAFAVIFVVGEKVDEKRARERQEQWEATRPTRDPEEVAQEARLPGVHKTYWELPIFSNRGLGSCKALKGDVALTVLFINDTVSSWSQQEIDGFIEKLHVDISELTYEASQWGTDLNITLNIRQGTLDFDLSPHMAWSSMNHILSKAGYDTYDILSILQDELGTESVPVMFAFNKAGRSYALQDYDEQNVEACYIFADPSATKHELLHLFGAADFYYHDQLDHYVNEFLQESIMSSSGGTKVDDLTAYLVGWTDGLTPEAHIPITFAGLIGTEELLEAQSDNGFTGYGTRTYDDGMVYNGMLELGVPNGYGEMLFASGDRYYGNFDNGYMSGYGVFCWTDGSVYEGCFHESQLEGEGKLTYPNGQVITGTWKNGEYIG